MNHKAIGLVLIVHVSAAISGLAFQNQTPAFTWQAGTQGFNEYGVYETKGLPSATANPGARAAAASWTDAAGNFWLYGGGRSKDFIGGYDLMDDLWRYSPETGKWTWVSGSSVVNQPPVYGSRGSAASLNSPGARWLSMYWTDASGNFWLFGGGIHGTGEANDLWKYDIQSGEWTWVSGSSVNPVAGNYGIQGLGSSSTSPGSRGIGATWTDQSGNLWLFGGNGYDSEGKFGPLNDLWKFSIGTGIWTWVGGSDKISAQPVYGTLGSASPSNNPGARWGTVTWQDPSGAFWLFGGSGYFGDLWKYDLVTGLWTYMSGNSTPNEFGVYGAVGVSSPENRPGARAFSIGWSDEFGDLWMFGGDGYDANGNSGLLSDLWKFDTSAEAWTWMGGSTERNQRGNYGMIGQADGTNMPGSRRAAVSWRAATGELWFFGGEAADLQGNWAARDDLWKISMQRDSSVPDYLPTDGLLGWWPFNGNAQDESGNEYHGMADGVTLTKDRFDQPGRAFAFDGIDDYIDLYSVKNLLSAINGLEKFTLSYWAYTYPNSTGSIWGHWSSNGGVVGYNGGMVSGFRPVDGWGFYAGNYAGCCAFIQSSFNNFGKWVHVAMVYDATKSNNADVLKMYYNGQPFESLPGTISNTPGCPR